MKMIKTRINLEKYTYRVGDKVLYRRRSKRNQKHERPYDGPFKILEIYKNGTVKLDRDNRVKQRCNMRLIYPYKF